MATEDLSFDFGGPYEETVSTYSLDNASVGTTGTGEYGSLLGGGDTSSFNSATLIPALTTALGVITQEADRDAKAKRLSTQMNSISKSFGFKQNLQGQQLRDLDRMLGDQMSSSGLEAIKAEGRLKAASAETGGTGASNSEAIQTAEVNQLHRDAAIIRTADVRKSNALNSMVADRLGFENQLEGLLSGATTDISALLQAANSGISGFNIGLSYLGESSKQDLFGTNTTGVL